MATAKKKKTPPARSRRTTSKSGSPVGKYLVLVLLAAASLAGGYELRHSGLYHGQIHHWLSYAHLAFVSLL